MAWALNSWLPATVLVVSRRGGMEEHGARATDWSSTQNEGEVGVAPGRPGEAGGGARRRWTRPARRRGRRRPAPMRAAGRAGDEGGGRRSVGRRRPRAKEEAAADRASGAGAGPRARVGGGGELVPRGHVAAAGWMAAAGGRCPAGGGHVRRRGSGGDVFFLGFRGEGEIRKRRGVYIGIEGARRVQMRCGFRPRNRDRTL